MDDNRNDLEKLANAGRIIEIGDKKYEQKEATAFDLLDFLSTILAVISHGPDMLDIFNAARNPGNTIFMVTIARNPKLLENIIWVSFASADRKEKDILPEDVDYIKSNSTDSQLIDIAKTFLAIHHDRLNDLIVGFIPGIEQSQDTQETSNQ
jgi:hypothetical protein